MSFGAMTRFRVQHSGIQKAEKILQRGGIRATPKECSFAADGDQLLVSELVEMTSRASSALVTRIPSSDLRFLPDRCLSVY